MNDQCRSHQICLWRLQENVRSFLLTGDLKMSTFHTIFFGSAADI